MKKLKRETLSKYLHSDQLERSEEDEEDGKPVYFHSLNCPSFCDYACNGGRGTQIAEELDAYECSLTRHVTPKQRKDKE